MTGLIEIRQTIIGSLIEIRQRMITGLIEIRQRMTGLIEVRNEHRLNRSL